MSIALAPVFSDQMLPDLIEGPALPLSCLRAMSVSKRVCKFAHPLSFCWGLSNTASVPVQKQAIREFEAVSGVARPIKLRHEQDSLTMFMLRS
jgi:hypothetical protein